jgi:hypothetical protein
VVPVSRIFLVWLCTHSVGLSSTVSSAMSTINNSRTARIPAGTGATPANGGGPCAAFSRYDGFQNPPRQEIRKARAPRNGIPLDTAIRLSFVRNNSFLQPITR